MIHFRDNSSKQCNPGRIAKSLLVGSAHNAPFDIGVLKKCLHDYDIIWKERVSYVCTVRIGRKILPDISHRLNEMCKYYQIELDHHKADSDSRACAEILIRYMQSGVKVYEHKKTWWMK